MDRFTVSDGTDTATLTGDPERPDVELRRWSVDLDLPNDGPEAGNHAERGCRMLEAATQAVSMQGGGRLEFWIQQVDPQSDQVPTAAGFTPHRDLLRLRRELPALPTDLTTRPFTPEDAEAFLTVNNLAFDWHPEHHGRGLGRALTLAGLAHLAGRGLRNAILYVESDNRPALRMYWGLGFDKEFTNRAYQRIVR